MPRTLPPALVLPGLALALAIAGCSPTGFDMARAATPSSAAARQGAGESQRNPQPQRPYRLTVMSLTRQQ